MNKKAVGNAGLILVVLGLLAMICVVGFKGAIRQAEWIDVELASIGCFLVCLTGMALGWFSFKTRTGKVSAIFGTILVFVFLLQYVLFLIGSKLKFTTGHQPLE